MKRTFYILSFVCLSYLVFVLGFKGHPKAIIDADFDNAMGKNSPEWHQMINDKGSKERLQVLRELYEEVKPSRAVASEEPRIPKIIHQIWLGPKSPPGYYWDYKESWKKFHPDWEYRFWTDKEVQDLDFDLKDLYNRTPNWGEKSDILRAALLDRFGGLYIDTDFECVKSFDELNYKYDFYAGLEAPHNGDITSSAPHVTISDALIGAAPGHPIIRKWKSNIRSHWDEYEKKYPDSIKRVLMRTFYSFGKACISKLHSEDKKNIIFPATYFFPLSFTEISKGRLKRFSFLRQQARHVLTFLNISNPTYFVEVQPETMAIHYWGNSWVKSSEERFRDMHKQIVEMQREFREEIIALQAELDSLKAQK